MSNTQPDLPGNDVVQGERKPYVAPEIQDHLAEVTVFGSIPDE